MNTIKNLGAVACLVFTFQAHAFDFNKALGDFSKSVEDYGESLKFKNPSTNTPSTTSKNQPVSNNKTSVNTIGLKRYEVDGAAIGDNMEAVLKKWRISSSEVRTIMGESLSLYRREFNIPKDQLEEAKLKWNESFPLSHHLEYTVKDKDGALRVKYKAGFDQNNELSTFIIKKEYSNELAASFPMKELASKLVKKYGEPSTFQNYPLGNRKLLDTDFSRLQSYSIRYGIADLAVTVNNQQGYRNIEFIGGGVDFDKKSRADYKTKKENLISEFKQKYPLKNVIIDTQF